MKQFYEIRPNITRCVYLPQASARQEYTVVQADMKKGRRIQRCPVPVLSVHFSPRAVERLEPDGPPEIRVVETVDGQRTQIDNLRTVHEGDAWRAQIRLLLAPDEHLYGLGQDEDGVLDKRGHMEYLYQHNMKIPMPVLVSSRGYAILADCGCLMTFDARYDIAVWTLECVQCVDLYVITGSMDEIVAGLRELTGRAAPLPAWCFGYWQSKEKYSSQQELLDVARRYRREGVPLDVVVQDWKTWPGELWGDKHPDSARYPDLSALRTEMHRMGIHTVVSVWPNMNSGGADHREFAQNGKLLCDYSTYNAFDPQARAMYGKQAAGLQDGFDGWWCDNTEPFTSPDWCGEKKLPEETRYRLVGGEHERYLGPQRANLYALAHARGFWENQPDRPVVNLTRAGWIGIQKYGAILWAGDTSATWAELRREIAKGLSMGLSGIPYWTVDGGAFFAGGTACWRRWKQDPEAAPVWFWAGDYDDGVQDLGYQELYTRWMQFACFLPIFRSHGTDTPREVWNFSSPFREAIEDAIRLRYRLMPYILEMARRVTEEHFTIMRSLLFDFPQDPLSLTLDDEFMFGNDLLVCPVLEAICYHAHSRPVEHPACTRRCYLPTGTGWTDFWTGEHYRGGQWIEVPLVLERIPLFVREGVQLTLAQGNPICAEDCLAQQV